MDAEEFIQHYGVPGMKWGRRKSSSSVTDVSRSAASKSSKPSWQRTPTKQVSVIDSTPTKKLSRRERRKQPKEISEEALQFKSIRAKAKQNGVQALSNSEIKQVTERMNLQKKYSEAFPKKKSPLSRGAGLVIEGILSDYGSSVLMDKVAGPMPRTLKKAQIADKLVKGITGAREIRTLLDAKKKSNKNNNNNNNNNNSNNNNN